jgi:hypothetical protein
MGKESKKIASTRDKINAIKVVRKVQGWGSRRRRILWNLGEVGT